MTDQQPTLIQCPDLFRKLNRNVNTSYLILKIDNFIIDTVRNTTIEEETVNKKSALNIAKLRQSLLTREN